MVRYLPALWGPMSKNVILNFYFKWNVIHNQRHEGSSILEHEVLIRQTAVVQSETNVHVFLFFALETRGTARIRLVRTAIRDANRIYLFVALCDLS